MEMNKKYRPVIGLEIHVELNTKSKMFCQCPADYFGAKPNTHTCPVCLGMPGGLPVPNKTAIESTILLGKALNCKINNEFKFERKHYFYPDLAKGYQISQEDEPIAEHGIVPILINGKRKEFKIKRVHLEEDTGKLTHSGEETLIDFNRGGVPLVEIVTESDFDDGEEVKVFLEELQVIVRYLGIANADMEKGDMRLEPNISVQIVEKLPELPSYKVEVKNINSFRCVKKTIEYDVERQIEILENGEVPKQETRGFDSSTNTTVSQRSKENAEDYRYLPEPDIPSFEYTDEEYDVICSAMPELPFDRMERYVDEFGVRSTDAFFLTRDKALSDFFDVCLSYLNEKKVFDGDTAQILANHIINKKVPINTDPEVVVSEIIDNAKPVETDKGLLDEAVTRVIEANPNAVDDFTSGKNPNSIMFLVGQVMKEMKGRADAQMVKEALNKRLS